MALAAEQVLLLLILNTVVWCLHNVSCLGEEEAVATAVAAAHHLQSLDGKSFVQSMWELLLIWLYQTSTL